MNKNVFPKDFLWGASTASHQVEGKTHNQWSEWENGQAAHLAQTASKRLSRLPAWQRIAVQAQDPKNYISGDGVGHYERYEEDFDLLQSLGMNSFRFGIEWSRIEPREGIWDEQAIAHYRAYIQALKARGITPVLTLWHWTMPIWFTDKGGFEHRRNVTYFKRYTRKIIELFGGDVPYIVTLNEPNVYTSLSYVSGIWPPQRKNLIKAFRVYRNLVEAHRQAYRVIKQLQPDIRVGIAAQLSDMRLRQPWNPVSHSVVALKRYVWNWWFLDRICRQCDFIGLNYYFTEYCDWLGRVRNPKNPSNDLGWYMEPSGIKPLLEAIMRRYDIPIIITENGLADATDEHRAWWLQETVAALGAAITAGVDLHGYLHWSLLDNFEWGYGWWPEFGLASVDRVTMRRTVRPSAKVFARIIKELSEG